MDMGTEIRVIVVEVAPERETGIVTPVETPPVAPAPPRRDNRAGQLRGTSAHTSAPTLGWAVNTRGSAM